MERLDQLVSWIISQGFRVTCTTGGQHSGAGHRECRAVDVGMNGVSPTRAEALIARARALGLTVIDERIRPAGRAFRFWTGPNLHIEIPRGSAATAPQPNDATAAPSPAERPPVTVQRGPLNPNLTRFIILAAALLLVTVAFNRLAN